MVIPHYFADGDKRHLYGRERTLLSRFRTDKSRSCYRAERGSRRPTPYFEGDLDRDVFGIQQWPWPKQLLLARVSGRLQLAAGQIAGITDGTILSVSPPHVRESVLGHVEVTGATPTAATVKSIAYSDGALTPLDDFPDRALCRIVSQQLGDMRIRVALLDSGAPALRHVGEQLKQAIISLASPKACIVQLMEEPNCADWILVVAAPRMAMEMYGEDIQEPSVLLVPREALDKTHRKVDAAFAVYSVSDIERLSSQVGQDLRKAFTWDNLWRVASTYNEATSELVKNQTVGLEVARLKGPTDSSRGEPLQTSQLIEGDCLAVRVVNTGFVPMWYTVFFLNGRLGIELVDAGSLPGRDVGQKRTERQVDRMAIDSTSLGTEGYVVVTVSQKELPGRLRSHQTASADRFPQPQRFGPLGRRLLDGPNHGHPR